MSLKQRLVTSLVVVIMAALLIVGWVGYTQAGDALRLSVSEQLTSTAADAARSASIEHQRLTDGLSDLAETPEVADLLSGDVASTSSERIQVVSERIRNHPFVGGLLATGGIVELRSMDGNLLLSVAGNPTGPPTGSLECPRAPRAEEFRFAVPVDPVESGTSIGSLSYRGPAEFLLSGSGGWRLVGTDGWGAMVDSERGETVLQLGCVDEAALGHEPGVPARSPGPVGDSVGSVARGSASEDDGQVVVRSEVQGTDFTVVAAASSSEFLVPLQEAGRSYGLFIFLVALGAGIFGVLIVNRHLSSLEEVASATTRIGEDQPVPWLPPPGNDEVGRLTLALNQLADRVDRRMESAEHVGRMTAIRELAAHLVRDIKNPLSSLRLSLQGIQREVESGGMPERWQEAIETSLSELGRVDRVISYILKAGQQRKAIMAPCSIREAIHDCAHLLSEEFERKSIRFRAYLYEGSDLVLADSGRLKNSILQLLQNSVEELGRGGLLEMRTERVEWRGDTAVILVVRDDGPGVDPEIRGRIFDPFFSTKPDAAGIGLAVALRNVREFGGELRQTRLPDVEGGAEFSIILPLMDAQDHPETLRSKESGGREQ